MKLAQLLIVLLFAAQIGAQQPVDTSTIGPRVGTMAPAFSGRDQDGVTRSLASAAGPKGTMLVFFRSADW
jgi:hypothetical protein